MREWMRNNRTNAGRIQRNERARRRKRVDIVDVKATKRNIASIFACPSVAVFPLQLRLVLFPAIPRNLEV